MRLRVALEHASLPPRRFWIPADPSSSISSLASEIAAHASLPVPPSLELDGFELLPGTQCGSILKEGDLVTAKEREDHEARPAKKAKRDHGAVPLSLGKAKKKQVLELLKKKPLHRRFDDDEEEHADAGLDHGNGAAHHHAAHPPQDDFMGRLKITEVYLYDDFGPKWTRGGGRRKSGGRGGRQRNSDTYYYDYDAAAAEEVDGEAEVEYEKDEAGPAKAPPVERDYAALPALVGVPGIGQMIAYRTLEMSPNYQPVISAYKEAVVKAYDPSSAQITLQVQPYSVAERPTLPEEDLVPGKKHGAGKFELQIEGVELLEQYLKEVTTSLDMLHEVKVIPAEDGAEAAA
ncbi:hypothetical protein DFJ74DRAFT_707573 [Hyaloraphidium curvatum]|nr:hypothetical protein DFJ74DRAFT_707573 [Hyaloraphidium curvatum]